MINRGDIKYKITDKKLWITHKKTYNDIKLHKMQIYII